MTTSAKYWLLIFVTAASIGGLIFVKAVPQDPEYHLFADRRNIFGVSNFWNVITNIPFLIIGIYGLSLLNKAKAERHIKVMYSLIFSGLVLTSLGSAYYHFSPNNFSLVFDRIPMTIVFMSFLASLISERINFKLGVKLLFPLLLVGVGSVLYWYYTELHYAGDLRLYGWVQFYPILLIVMVFIFFPLTNSRSELLFILWIFVWYAIAKICEHYDEFIYTYCGFSGHSLKHLTAAIASWYIVVIFKNKYALNAVPRTMDKPLQG